MRVRLTIFRKGLILVAVPLLFQLAFFGLLADMQRGNSQAVEWSIHSKAVLWQSQVVLRTLFEVGTGLRGSILSDDPDLARVYDRGIGKIPKDIRDLHDRVSDNPEQVAHVEAIARATEEFLAWHAETVRLSRTGQKPQAIARAKSERSGRLQDAIRQAMLAFLQTEDALDRERTAVLEQTRRRQQGLLLAGTAASFVLTLALAFFFSRGISGRLATLADNARRLAQGRPLAAPLAGGDELTLLDRNFRDTAEQLARSQGALREQNRLMQSVLDGIGEGVVVADAHGRFLIFNPAAQRILGLGPTPAGPDDWNRIYGTFRPDGVTPFPAADLPLVRALRGEADDDVAMCVRNPQVPEGVWVTFSGRPLRDEEGTLRGGVVVFRDETERRRAEAAVRRLNDDLERRVHERTAELAEVNRDLSEKNRENEMFVYSVSHDLRSPLVNLEGFSQELALSGRALLAVLDDPGVPAAVRERGRALLDGDVAEALRFIHTGVRRLSGIIDALLRLSRAGRVEFRRQRVDVAALVKHVVESMRATIGERRAAVVVHHLPPAWGDATALEQVFANLVGNALKYLDPARPGRVEVGGGEAPADGCATYYVRDNGLGIPAAYRDKVFQAFQRLHPEAAEGEGMGLAIVRRVVERHHGRVWVESEPGQGSTFFVALPLAPPDARDGLGSAPLLTQTGDR